MNTMETVNLNVIENDGFAKMNVVQPGNVAMAAEQVEVVQAYSPTVDLEELENGVTIKVTDHRGTDSATVDLSETIGSFESYMAIYSRNLGDIEGTVEEVKETAQRADAVADALEAALTEIDNALEGTSLSQWSRLNRPNLLKQNFWTYHALLERNIVYGNASRWSASGGAYWRSFKNPTKILDHSTTAPTAEQIAAACAYYQTVEEDGVTYYDLWQDDGDDWKVSVDSLAAADQITEADGEVYDKAIRLAITENSAYGHTETLSFNYPNTKRWYKQGETKISNYGHIEEMTPGETYTMSCWARVVSGGDVWCRMGWGSRYGNTPFHGGTNQDISDWIVISGSEWKRYSWTFTFNPTGDWYTETTEEVTPETGDPYTRVIREYNWNKSVQYCFGRKNTSVCQICGFRLTEGGLYLPTKFDECESKIAALTQRVEELEALVIENQGS